MQRLFALLTLSALMVSNPGGDVSAAINAADDSASVNFHWAVKIPLRDGIRLNATLYTPKQQVAAGPCVVTLTPYIADSYHGQGIYFAAHNIAFAVVDVRGRGNSEGIFRPFIQESQDGYDVVEWLARQSYCNGKVAMWGGSYAGYDQWATAKEYPPHLATIVPVAAPHIGTDFPMRNNIFYPYLVQWLTFTGGHTLQENIFDDNAFWSAAYRDWYNSGRPFQDLDARVGNPSLIFQEWLSHPQQDDYWDRYNPTAEDYARIQIPILTITGSYDDDQPGALEHYRQSMRNASPQMRARHYLVIGPWDHAGTRAPKLEVGGVKFGSASLLDLPKLHLDWYAWTMANQSKPEFLQGRVAYYVMGAERWKYADTLDEVTATSQPFFLDSTSNANDVFSGGKLQENPGRGEPDAYQYDPRDVSGPEVAAESQTSGGTLADQTVLFALHGKELVYHTAPFQRDTEITGFFKLTAWISIDCPDTDLYVSVYEIRADGSSIRLSTDALRARYRQGLRAPELIHTNAPLRYDFEHFTFTSRQLTRGSRLRLVIAPMGRLVETTFAERNFNAGGVVANESRVDGRTVTVRLFHDRAHQSVLSVPIGRVDSTAQTDEVPARAYLAHYRN